MGAVSFALGLMVAFGLVVYAAWMAIAALTTMGNAAAHVGSSDSSVVGPSGHRVVTQRAAPPPAVTPPGAALPSPTPTGTTLRFDQLWISRDGNTIVAGAPTMGVSQRTGEPVITIPVTLTNNGTQGWNPESTTFGATLNRATVPESDEGNWMYRAPIAGRTSVTLTKVFVARPGQFTLTVTTPQGEALFTGRV